MQKQFKVINYNKILEFPFYVACNRSQLHDEVIDLWRQFNKFLIAICLMFI